MPIKIMTREQAAKQGKRKKTNAPARKPKTDRQLMSAMKKGGSMKKKGYAMGGAMKKKGMAKGGKLKMVEKDGKKVPFFAADGKGKMAKGGMMKKKGYAKGGSVKVKSGDTLSQIAKSKGLTVKALLDANPGIKNANMIRVGQSIKIPGAAAGAGAKSKNPFKGMTKTQMAMLGSKDKGKQRAATRGARAQTATTPSNAAKVKASKDGTASAMAKARARRAAAKKVPMPTPKPAKPVKKRSPGRGATPVIRDLKRKPSRRDGRKAMGGMMKKKGMSKGGAMKRSKGGTVRGAGAATRGKRFGRAG